MKKEFTILISLSFIFVLVYFLYPNIQGKEEITDSVSKKQDLTNISNNILNFQKNSKFLTFDIVRVTKQGDVVMAGQSQPNENIELLNNDQVIANFLSDANGEWVWISDLPLQKGIKKFEIRYVDKNENLNTNSQTVIIFNDDKKFRPTVAKLTNKKKINILNFKKIQDGLSLDLVDYSPSGDLILSGRTLPGNKIKFLKSGNEFEYLFSDEDGNWKLVFNINDLKKETLTISTKIKNEELLLSFKQTDLKSKFNIETLNANEIIVEPGNSLWRIARKTMGGGIFYSEIYKNNLMRIKNPDLIYPGQVFNIPKIRKNISYE